MFVLILVLGSHPFYLCGSYWFSGEQSMRFSVWDEHDVLGSPNHARFCWFPKFSICLCISGSVVLSVSWTSSGVDLALEVLQVLLSVIHILRVVLQLEVL